MRTSRRHLAAALAAGLLGACLGGCATVGVKPWEHDLLAKKRMALVPDPLEMALDQHIYFSKEATTGGAGLGGGGCGCN
jgi:hypothetical protein